MADLTQRMSSVRIEGHDHADKSSPSAQQQQQQQTVMHVNLKDGRAYPEEHVHRDSATRAYSLRNYEEHGSAELRAVREDRRDFNAFNQDHGLAEVDVGVRGQPRDDGNPNPWLTTHQQDFPPGQSDQKRRDLINQEILAQRQHHEQIRQEQYSNYPPVHYDDDFTDDTVHPGPLLLCGQQQEGKQSYSDVVRLGGMPGSTSRPHEVRVHTNVPPTQGQQTSVGSPNQRNPPMRQYTYSDDHSHPGGYIGTTKIGCGPVTVKKVDKHIRGEPFHSPPQGNPRTPTKMTSSPPKGNRRAATVMSTKPGAAPNRSASSQSMRSNQRNSPPSRQGSVSSQTPRRGSVKSNQGQTPKKPWK
jgi:hypothetical protein